MTAAEECKHNVWVQSKPLACCQQGVELMGAPEVARVADDEFAFQAPFAAQWVVDLGLRGDLLVVAPIVDSLDLLRSNAACGQLLVHPLADNDVGGGVVQRCI